MRDNKMARLVTFGILAMQLAAPAIAGHKSPLEPAAKTMVDSAGLLSFETVQLTDSVIANLAAHGLTDTRLFAFGKEALPVVTRSRSARAGAAKCKTYPGDTAWPSEPIWHLFDVLLGGALIKTVPEAAVCHAEWDVYSPSCCRVLSESWENWTLRVEDATSIRAVLYQGMTCVPPDFTAVYLGNASLCSLGGFPEYTVNISTVAQIQLAVNIARELNLRLVIKNTGHDFLAKSTGRGSLSIWTHHLKDFSFHDNYTTDSYSGPAFRFGAGIQVWEANAMAKQRGVTVVGGEGKDVGLVGGYVQGAFPQIRVTTMRYNVTTDGANFTEAAFWAAQRAYLSHFERYADLGYYGYTRTRRVAGGQINHFMGSMVAPKATADDVREALAPQRRQWEALGAPFAPVIREFDNYADAWADGFPAEGWTAGIRQASRLVPRDVLADAARRDELAASLRSVFEAGANFVAFNVRNPPAAAAVENAVNPAWRRAVMFVLMFVTWDAAAPAHHVEALSRNLTAEWSPRWRALTPGSGTYGSEADYIEPDWQQSFHGAHYPRLYRIKQQWDPSGVFYAHQAVGSEDWQTSEMLLGHLPSQNSRLCRREG